MFAGSLLGVIVKLMDLFTRFNINLANSCRTTTSLKKLQSSPPVIFIMRISLFVNYSAFYSLKLQKTSGFL